METTLTASPKGVARAPIDRAALVRAMVSAVPRARARAALRSVRAYLRVVLGAAEVHEFAITRGSRPDADLMLESTASTLGNVACSLIGDPDDELVSALVAVLLGETPSGYTERFGVFAPGDERRDALRALRIVGRVSRDLRAGGGVS